MDTALGGATEEEVVVVAFGGVKALADPKRATVDATAILLKETIAQSRKEEVFADIMNERQSAFAHQAKARAHAGEACDAGAWCVVPISMPCYPSSIVFLSHTTFKFIRVRVNNNTSPRARRRYYRTSRQ
mmetsp:Transcript_21337/g.43845  ORF Transcript_21337/g.43845 Transcript_21337/m.43845 type:complete len:130 (+) Transcript_21337:4805-5194(+)